MRRLRRFLAIFAILIAVAIAVGYLLWRAGPLRQRLRAVIAAELSRAADRPVSIRDISLGLTGRVVLHDLVIENRDGSKLLVAPEASARLGRPSKLSLSAAASAVKAITLRRPEITLTRSPTRKWSIDDLITRPKRRARFTGDVVVDDGKIKVIDQANRGLTTELDQVYATLEQPGPGQVIFSVRARGTEGSFDRLQAKGRSDSKAGVLEASGSAADLDLAYAFARLSRISAFVISAGRADITGLVSGKGDAGRPGSGITVNAEVEQAEVSFPWLRRPLTSIQGKVRFADGTLHLDDITGQLAGAPVTARGSITDLARPHLDIDYTATGLRFKQLRSLLPKLYVPMTLALPSPLRIVGHVQGPVEDVTVEGRAEVRVLKFHLVPWHDVAATFTYTKHGLRVWGLRAHGSPRQLEADLEVTWRDGRPQARASFDLKHVPFATLAQMLGLQALEINGTASLKGVADVGGGASFSGRFTIREGAYRELRLGAISGEIEYAKGAAHIYNARIDGPTAKGEFSAKLTQSGSFQVQADLSSLDLSAVGRAFGQPRLQGCFPASARASGSFRQRRVSGSIKLGPGRVEARGFASAAADFALSPGRLHLPKATLTLPNGTYQGALLISDWPRRGAQAPLLGRATFTGASPADWLPPPYGLLVTAGSVDGAAAISGTVADPRLKMSLRLNSLSAPWFDSATGTVQLRYQGGAFLVDDVNVTEDPSQLTITGSALPDRLALEVSGDQVDLRRVAAGLLRGTNLSIGGTAKVRATVLGSFAHPRLQAALSARPVAVDDRQFDELAATLYTADNVLHLQPVTLRRGESIISASGTIGLRPGGPHPLDLTIGGDRVDLAVFTPELRRISPDLSLDGAGEMQVRIIGPWARPQVTFTVAAQTVSVSRTGAQGVVLGRLSFDEIACQGQYAEDQLRLDKAFVRQNHSEVSVSGSVDLPPAQTPDVNLSIGLTDIDLFTAIWRLDQFGINLYRALHYRATPKLMGGRLRAAVKVTGTPSNPQLQVSDLVLSDLSLGDVVDLARGESLRRQIRRIEGDLALDLHADLARRSLALRRLEITRLRAVHDPAVATLIPPAWVVPDGEMLLRVTVDNLDLGLLAPWLRYAANLSAVDLSGQATINFDITGPTRRPDLRGDIAAQDVRIGPLVFENMRANPIRLKEGGLEIEEIDLSRGRFTPVPGMTPFQFDAGLSLSADKLLVYRPVEEAGAPLLPGIRGQAGGGTFTAQGEIQLPSRASGRRYGRLNLRALLDGVDLVLPDMLRGKLSGELRLVNESGPGGPPLVTTRTAEVISSSHKGGQSGLAPDDQPLVLSDAVLALPATRGSPAGLPSALQLDVGLLIGENVHFRHGSGRRPTDITVDPGRRGPPSTGYLRLQGTPTWDGLLLEGRAESHMGTLAFPNGSLTLRQATAEVTRGDTAARAGQPPQLWVTAEADGRIGDYYIAINPAGRIYPPPSARIPSTGLSLNAISVPPLAPAYITALLAGQTLAPAVAGTPEIAELLANPGATGITGGPLTGLVLPASPLGLHELSFDVALHGPVSMRVGERLLRNLLLSYVSPLSGPPESRTFRITYQVTPHWSLGWSLNELERVRWEVLGFRYF